MLCLARPFDLIGSSGTVDGAALDSELCNATPFGQVPRNAFFGLNNNFNKMSLVNGVDYISTIKGHRLSFPNGVVMDWHWPNAGNGAVYAYAYPVINFGGSNYVNGNPYDTSFRVTPAAKQIKDFVALTCTYSITLGGNLNSYDILLDSFITASPTSTDGSYVAEVSFYPFNVPNIPLYGSRYTLSFADCYIGQLGQEILVQPVVTGTSIIRNILAATINFKEIFTKLIRLGMITGNEYVRGFQLGAEVQVPASYNSMPHKGSMRINRLSYDWR